VSKDNEKFLDERAEMLSQLSEDISSEFAEAVSLMIPRMMENEDLIMYFPDIPSRGRVVKNILLSALTGQKLRNTAHGIKS